MSRWLALIAAVLLACAPGLTGRNAVAGAPASSRASSPRVALDSLVPLGLSRPTAINNYSAVRIVAHAGLAMGDGTTIDHAIMFGLNPGHGGGSEADMTFRLGRTYDRLSGVLYTSSGSGPTAPTLQFLDVSNRARPPRVLFVGQADPTGRAAFTMAVRGVSLLEVTASASFSCVCDSGSTALVVATLTAPRASSRSQGGSGAR